VRHSRGFAIRPAAPLRQGRRAAGRVLLAGGGALGLLVLSGAAADAQALRGAPAAPSVDCTADAAGMMTMPDGMKMPVAQMPGCGAVKGSTTKSAPPGPATGASSAAGSAKSTPQKVHAGTGGQASETGPTGLPLAPFGLVAGGLGLTAVAARRLQQG